MDKKDKLQKFFSDNVLNAFSETELEKLKTAYTLGMRKDESVEMLKFLIAQSNFSDAIRFLIQKEVAENGVRDLSKFIPSVRDKNFFSNKSYKELSGTNENKTNDLQINNNDANKSELEGTDKLQNISNVKLAAESVSKKINRLSSNKSPSFIAEVQTDIDSLRVLIDGLDDCQDKIQLSKDLNGFQAILYSVQNELQKQLEELKIQQERNNIDVQKEKRLESQETKGNQDSKDQRLSDVEKKGLDVY